MSATPQICARELLEVTPAIIQAIRVEMRAQRQHDLSVPQFRALAFISNKPGSSLSAAAEHIGLTLPTMSVLVEGLVQRGLVQRVPDLRDRRRVLLTLTAEGKALHERALLGRQPRWRYAGTVGRAGSRSDRAVPCRCFARYSWIQRNLRCWLRSVDVYAGSRSATMAAVASPEAEAALGVEGEALARPSERTLARPRAANSRRSRRCAIATSSSLSVGNWCRWPAPGCRS